jgi:hypothetical protein
MCCQICSNRRPRRWDRSYTADVLEDSSIGLKLNLPNLPTTMSPATSQLERARKKR